MKDPISSSASSDEQEENGVEEEGEDMLTVAESSQSHQRQISPTTPNPIPLSMVAPGCNEGSPNTSHKRALTDQSTCKSCAIKHAEELKGNLDNAWPGFVKSMLPSHIIGKCRLRLPSDFCNNHLPKQNMTIYLIDENQKEYPVQYLLRKKGLSGGWKGFTIAHKLVEGDVLVFQLVKPTKFQVYITRADSMDDINGVIGLRNSDACEKHIESCKRSKTIEAAFGRYKKTAPVATLQQPEGSRYGSRKISEVEGIRSLGTSVELKSIKNLESFIITVNGSIINSELSDQTRSKYYELCCSQESLIHENLVETIDHKLAAGFISQTVSIADAIKASKLSTSRDEFAAWDTNLGAFEQLGMNVGFLRARVKKLVRLVDESKEGINSNRYREAIAGKYNVLEEIKTLKAKLFELEEASKRFDSKIEYLEMKSELYELKFRAEVDAPW